jgi:hypothetical protein
MRPIALMVALSLVVFAAFPAGAQDAPIPVRPAGIFPVKIVGSETAIPVTIEKDDEPYRVEVINPDQGPMEIYTTGVLPVQVINSANTQVVVPRFTVLGFTEAVYRGGKLGGALGASDKCQAEFGDGAVMCRDSFVQEDYTAVPMDGELYGWVDRVEGTDDNCTGSIERRSDPEVLGSGTSRWMCSGTQKACTVSASTASNRGSVVSPDLTDFESLACALKRPIACCGWALQ